MHTREAISEVTSEDMVNMAWNSLSGFLLQNSQEDKTMCRSRASLVDVSIPLVFCLFSSRSKHVL